MNVILLEKVNNLGLLGDQVNVKPGYARNCLIPQKKAVFATKENITAFEEKRAALEKAEAEKLALANQRKEALSVVTLQLAVKAGDEGKLYGSLGTADIAEAVTSAGVEVYKREVRMPNGPIRHIGEHVISFVLHSDVTVDLTVTIVPE